LWTKSADFLGIFHKAAALPSSKETLLSGRMAAYNGLALRLFFFFGVVRAKTAAPLLP
jgi:hypothetical protein